MRLTAALLTVVMLGWTTNAEARHRPQVPATTHTQSRRAFLGPIDSQGTAATAELLGRALENNYPEIIIDIDSPGGSVALGFDVINVMRAAERNGTVVVCRVEDGGIAASMAAVILEGCSIRLMGRQSQLLFHTVSMSGASGNAWDFARLAREMESYNDRMAAFVVGRLNISIEEYKKQVADRDWWLGAEQAIAIGAVDGIG